jgi:hypothetical protein
LKLSLRWFSDAELVNSAASLSYDAPGRMSDHQPNAPGAELDRHKLQTGQGDCRARQGDRLPRPQVERQTWARIGSARCDLHDDSLLRLEVRREDVVRPLNVRAADA